MKIMENREDKGAWAVLAYITEKLETKLPSHLEKHSEFVLLSTLGGLLPLYSHH